MQIKFQSIGSKCFCVKLLNWSYLQLEYFLFQIYSQKVRVRVFNTTFNNFSATSWRSVLLVEKTADMSKVTDKLYSIMLYQVHYAWAKFELIGTDCIGSSHKSNYHAITTTTAPNIQSNLEQGYVFFLGYLKVNISFIRSDFRLIIFRITRILWLLYQFYFNTRFVTVHIAT
jgi:hypothetical protein